MKKGLLVWLSVILKLSRVIDKDKEGGYKQADVHPTAENNTSYQCANKEVCVCTVRLKADVPLAQDKNKSHSWEAFW